MKTSFHNCKFEINKILTRVKIFEVQSAAKLISDAIFEHHFTDMNLIYERFQIRKLKIKKLKI